MGNGSRRRQAMVGKQLGAMAIVVVAATACVQDGELDLPLERSVYETDDFVNLDVPGATADEVRSGHTPRPMPFASHDPDLTVSRIWREVSEEAFLVALAQSSDSGAAWYKISCHETQISLRGTKELGGFLRLEMFYVTGDSTLHASFTTGAGGPRSDRPDVDEGCGIEMVEAAGIEPDLERFQARAALEADSVLAPIQIWSKGELEVDGTCRPKILTAIRG